MAVPGTIEFAYRLERDSFMLDAGALLAARGIIGVFGRSGAGKSSLLRCIAGLEPAATGRLVFAGETWEDGDRGVRLTPEKRRVGYVFQDNCLFPHLSVRSNLDYGRRRRSGTQTLDFDAIVELLGLGALLERRPAGLSGGEAQRVAIGRAMLSAPRVLLLDEPVAALDVERKFEVLPFIQRLHGQSGIPVMYVTHSMDELCALCDQLVLLEDGRVAGAGDLQRLLLETGLPLLGGEQAGVLLDARVLGRDENDGLCALETASGTLYVPGNATPGERVRLRIRANDVSLARAADIQSSILNRVPVTIHTVNEEPVHSVLLHLDFGSQMLLARITKRSSRELGVRPGETFIAQIKAVSLRPART
jgi:molybdate transport system ATP-binding protein